MSAATATGAAAGGDHAAPKGGGGRKKLLVLGLPLLLIGGGAGLWFGGILPPLLGMGAKPAAATAAADPTMADKPAADAKPAAPVYVDLPEMIANLDAGPRRTSYVKMKARLELAKAEDVAAAQAAMPRLQDLFQTYLREMRPEELRGATGTYRLREELISRANMVLGGMRVQDVLFTEIIVQ
jgi:flagellar FliL protein